MGSREVAAAGRVSHVEAITGYELLCRIPRRRRFPDAPELAFADPVIGTAIRSLRVRVSGHLPSRSSVTVTSSLPGEGKTTTAALLATSFARTGVEVCLVDGDLRWPRLGKQLEGGDGVGLDRLLKREVELSEALVPGWAEHLTVLPTAADAGAGELLAERMPLIVAELLVAFELVVIDAPNVLGSDEARVLASGSDRVVFVVTTGTEHDAVYESHTTLAGLRASVAGYVLTRAPGGRRYRTATAPEDRSRRAGRDGDVAPRWHHASATDGLQWRTTTSRRSTDSPT